MLYLMMRFLFLAFGLFLLGGNVLVGAVMDVYDSPEQYERPTRSIYDGVNRRDNIRQRIQIINRDRILTRDRIHGRRVSVLETSTDQRIPGYRKYMLVNDRIELVMPEDFEKESDTLTEMMGMVGFENNGEVISLQSSGIKCSSGSAHLRNCVRKQTSDFARTFMEEDSRLEFLSQKSDGRFSLDNVQRKSDQANQSREYVVEQFSLQSNDRNVMVVGFTSPVQGYLWYLVFDGGGERDSVGRDIKVAYTVFTSIKSVSKSKAPTTTRRKVVENTRFRSQAGFRKENRNNSEVSDNLFEYFRFDSLGLSVSVPQNIRRVRDEQDDGVGFRGNGNGIEIEKTNYRCTENRSVTLRRCLEREAKELFQKEEGYKLLSQSFVPLDLDRSDSYKDGIGYFAMYEHTSGKRKGVLLFRDLNSFDLFRILIDSERIDGSILHSTLLLRKLYSSLFFSK